MQDRIIFTEDLAIADLASIYNALHVDAQKDVKQLGKMGKGKVREKIQATAISLGFDLANSANLALLVRHGSLDALRKALEAPAAKPKGKSEPKAKKEKGPVIRAVAEGLLMEVVTHDEDKRPYGHSYEVILNRIKAQFPEAKTTVACLRWYAVHMRERGERVPNRQRATPAKKED